MTFDDYQKESKKTARWTPSTDDISYLSLAIAGEAGELADKIKKVIRDNGGVINDESKHHIINEMGDMLWYMAQLCTKLKAPFSKVAAQNLEKVFSRLARNKIHGSGDNR